MFKRYTKASFFERLIFIVAGIVAIAVMIANTGKPPADISTFLTAHGNEMLAVRDWMQKNDLNEIKLLNKNNQNYGNGVCIQTGKRLYCYFEGPGTDGLFSTTFLDKVTEGMNKAFELDKAAREYGVYGYIRHQNSFEVIFCSNPVYRIGGVEGTSAYYSELPPDKINTETQIGVKAAIRLNNGWLLADTSNQSILDTYINPRSDLFMIIVAVILTVIISLIISLFYRKFGCNAVIAGMSIEYRGNKSRLQNMIDGVNTTIFENYTVYKIKFLTENNETLEMYVPELEYNRFCEKAHGYLKYKRLGRRCKYIRFEMDAE